MSNDTRHPILRFVQKAGLAHADQVPEAQLLERFILQRDDESFALLLHRHGPMVMGVCRRVLQHSQDAEDAFQATFLVLMRKADSIQPRENVGPWLYGVATRTSLEAKTLRAKRMDRESKVQPREDVTTDTHRHELQEVIDKHLSELPEKYRLPILLCDLQGKTQQDAARQLGWPEGTVSGRLFRGRQMLAQRLKKAGIAVTVASLSHWMSQQTWAVPPSGPMLTATFDTARACGFKKSLTSDVVSPQVLTLTQGALRTMFIARMKFVLAIVILLGLSVSLAGLLAHELLKKPEQKQVFTNSTNKEPKPLTPAQLFQQSESKILKANTVQCDWEFDFHLQDQKMSAKGKLLTKKPNLIRMDSRWEVPKKGKMAMKMVSNGKKMALFTTPWGQPMKKQQSQDASKHLRAHMVMALTRVGMSLPFTTATEYKPGEHPTLSEPIKFYKLSKIRKGNVEKINEKTATILHYQCDLASSPLAPTKMTCNVKVWIDAKTQFPIQREVIARDSSNKEKMSIKIVEKYSNWKLGKEIDDKQFQLTIE